MPPADGKGKEGLKKIRHQKDKDHVEWESIQKVAGRQRNNIKEKTIPHLRVIHFSREAAGLPAEASFSREAAKPHGILTGFTGLWGFYLNHRWIGMDLEQRSRNRRKIKEPRMDTNGREERIIADSIDWGG